MGKDEIEKAIEKVTEQYSQDPVTRKIERVAAYVRVSTQEQKLHGISLDAQKAKLTEYAKEHNMRIVDWYVDEGVSGRKLIKKRPELQRMIQDAEKKKFDRIIFIKLDRFFRSVAEYHECMKRIAPVVWSTTEEQYDLTTAQGRMLVNMKLTIAEMEADQGGERIRLVNEYKVQTGQPLTGSMQRGWIIVTDEETKRKKIIRDPDEEELVYDLIEHYETYQSQRKTIGYIYAKYHAAISHDSLKNLLTNTMLYGAYRDNPTYCEGYIPKERFDRLQVLVDRNIKQQSMTAEAQTYLFTGLIICPLCEKRLSSFQKTSINKQKKSYMYHGYRCANHYHGAKTCENNKTLSENVIERELLKNIDKYLAEAKIEQFKIEQGNQQKIKKYDIEDIHSQIDRLNYSWQTGKIRKVEDYEKRYSELLALLEKAEEEQGENATVDFAKVETILQSGWQGIYNALTAENKQAFWRSFIKSIELNADRKTIQRVNFF